MAHVARIWLVLTLAALAFPTSAAAAEPSVSLEIFSDSGVPVSASQEWYRRLTDLNVEGLRIATRRGEEPEIATEGKGDQARYRVQGILTARNELVLPGGKFGMRDSARLAKWLADLRENGPPPLPGEPAVPFGLRREQFVELVDALSLPVDESTADLDVSKALAIVRASVDVELRFEPGVAAQIKPAEWTGELLGISRGSALAILLRSAGLAMEPDRVAGGDIELVARPLDFRRLGWPVGTPVERELHKTAPKLFESLTSEIEDVPLAEVLAAVEPRVEIPFFVDSYALQRQRIDLAAARVNLPEQRTSYSLLLRKALARSQLKGELMTDDAGRPFLWITTIKPE